MPISPSFATPNPDSAPALQQAPPSRAPWLAAVARVLAKLQVLGDYDQMYRMLDADRIDVDIDTRVNGAHIVKRLGRRGVQAVGKLARLDLFNILDPAKTALAPKIAATSHH